MHIHPIPYIISRSSNAKSRLHGCTYIVFPTLCLGAAIPKRECTDAHTQSSLHYIWEQQCPSENARMHIYRLPYTISGSSNAQARLHGCTYVVFPTLCLAAAMPKLECTDAHTSSFLHFVWQQQYPSENARMHIHSLPYTISGSSNAQGTMHGCTYIVFPTLCLGAAMSKQNCMDAHTSSSLHYIWQQQCPSKTAWVHINRLPYTISGSSNAQARMHRCTYVVFPTLCLAAAMPKQDCMGAHKSSSLHYIWEQQRPSENARVHIHRLPYTISGRSNALARLRGCTNIIFRTLCLGAAMLKRDCMGAHPSSFLHYIWEQQCPSKTAWVHSKQACIRV